MCGIAGCYQQADGPKLTDIMTEWQLLTMELWYRNARSMGVAA